MVFISSPEHTVLKVSFCDGPLSVVHRPCVRLCVRQQFLLKRRILTKLHRNDPWVVPYQSCSNRFSWLHK